MMISSHNCVLHLKVCNQSKKATTNTELENIHNVKELALLEADEQTKRRLNGVLHTESQNTSPD